MAIIATSAKIKSISNLFLVSKNKSCLLQTIVVTAIRTSDNHIIQTTIIILSKLTESGLNKQCRPRSDAKECGT